MDLVPHLITTQGGRGSTVTTRSGEEIIPAAKPRVVKDTTGAGDGYRAGLLAGLEKGLTLQQSCQVGSVIGSFVVETVGAQTQVFTKKEVEKRYESTFGEKVHLG